jgi:hypothetical protein
MKEQEQSLPLLEKELLEPTGLSKSRYSLLSLKLRQEGFLVALGLYSLLVTGILIAQNLPHGITNAPYCKIWLIARRRLRLTNLKRPLVICFNLNSREQTQTSTPYTPTLHRQRSIRHGTI